MCKLHENDRVWCGSEVEKTKGRDQPTTEAPLSSARSSSLQKIGVSNDLGRISFDEFIGFFFFGTNSAYLSKQTILTEILVQLPTSCRG